jgi:tripartite-type tricarboxylate transporter receptor subunit TctC
VVDAGGPEVARRNAAASTALAQPDVQERARQAGFVLEGGGAEAASAFLAAEQEKWSRLVRERRLRLDG